MTFIDEIKGLTKSNKVKLSQMANQIMVLENVINPPIRRSIRRLLKDINIDEKIDFLWLREFVFDTIEDEIPEQDKRFIYPNLTYVLDKDYDLVVWKSECGKYIVKRRSN